MHKLASKTLLSGRYHLLNSRGLGLWSKVKLLHLGNKREQVKLLHLGSRGLTTNNACAI